MRITSKDIEAKLKTASSMGKFPQGTYPTVGQLVLDHNHYGYSINLVVNDVGGQRDISPTGMTARECWLWLNGFITALDLERVREHWNLPTSEA